MNRRMTPAEIADWAIASRRTQGLPDRVQDETLLAKIARLVDAGERGGADGRPAA
jgi:hypothetical protein